MNTSLPWHDLPESASGRTAYILGKGPSLDTWLAHGCPAPENAVFIALNQAAQAHPCHFGVANHHFHECPGPAVWLVSLPRKPSEEKAFYSPGRWDLPPWATHWFLHVHGFAHLEKFQDRRALAESRQLFNKASCLNPAVHFAWMLGCSRLQLVGVDPDVNAQAAVVAPYVPTPPDWRYRDTWLQRHGEILRRQCDTLFPGAWSFYPRG